METNLERPLHWSICLLHLNELPLRHLFTAVDGRTTDPETFNGPIGKLLNSCTDNPSIDFQILVAAPIKTDKSSLRSDQLYFYEIVTAVSSGNVAPGLAERSPGKLVQSRWLTSQTAFYVYVGCLEPSSNLLLLAQFIVYLYAPVWFAIKLRPNCWDAAKHSYMMVQTSKFLPVRHRLVIDKVLLRNSYPAHSESILLSMLKDTRQYMRNLAIKRILRARSENVPNRKFVIPEIAPSYEELINWQTEVWLEPTLTKHSSSKLHNIMCKEVIEVDLPAFPCHNQAVERLVKLVTEASKKVFGHDNRNGFIRVRYQRRSLMQK